MTYINAVQRYFRFAEHDTSFRKELLGGLTTFMTMAYIIVVNPKILQAAGFPLEASMAATIWTAFIGTLLMGIYAKRPFAIAPYMGENAFIAYTVVKVMGFSWQVALGGIFIAGLLFFLLSLSPIRSWLVRAIPASMKIGFSVGIGLFLTFIGLVEMGLVVIGVPGAPVHVGNLHDPQVLLGVCAFLLISFLMIQRVLGAFLWGMLGTTLLAAMLGYVQLPSSWISSPPSLVPLLGKLDIAGALTPEFAPLLLTIFIILFADTMGTLIGVAYRAGFLDQSGHLPEVEKAMLCDSSVVMAAAVLGTTPSGVFIESASGIEAGGRTGFSAMITALLFLVALFFAPILTLVPAYAYGPVLVLVGLLMLSVIRNLDFSDLTEAIPVFVIMTLMCFTYNIGVGLTAGLIVYPLMKLFAGRANEVSIGLWILGLVSLVFFVVYPF